VAEGARLESVYTGNRIVGSNPTPSASCLIRGSSLPSAIRHKKHQYIGAIEHYFSLYTFVLIRHNPPHICRQNCRSRFDTQTGR
jgi:hypothetical protein